MKPTTTIFTAILLLFAFAACKKEDNRKDHFDPAAYYITGTIEATGTDSAGYALLFQPNGTAVAISAHKTANATYEFQEGHLKFVFENSNEGFDFTIANNRIIDASELTHTLGLPNTYTLQKIPGTDDFKGKTFKGQFNNTAISVRFGSDGSLEVSQVLNGVTISQKGNYDLQNNAVAKASIKNVDSFLCIMLDGKLTISTSNAAGDIQKYTVLTLAN